MDNYKIKVKDEAESKEAQELFFELGFQWYKEDKGVFWETTSGFIFANGNTKLLMGGVFMDADAYAPVTIPQLRDIVAQNKSNLREYLDPNDNYKLCLINPSDAAHWMIEVPDGAELYVYWRENDTYNFQVDKSYFENGSWQPCAWTVEEIKSDKAGAKILWSRKQKQDPALISGADVPALIKKGESVQFRSTFNVQGGGEWKDLDLERDEEEFSLGDLINTRFEWRIKPQTIKLELELPKPFEPKEGEMYWFVSPFYSTGYDSAVFEDHQADKLQVQYGAYRTQVEIKQVVEQLRKIRGTNS
ncbi:hypothetical protein ACB014_02100 [Acinetobacter baumannii]|nr:hypothetical protein [Acinetobacter baumannii]